MKIKIKKINPETKLPEYAHPGEDVGMDVFSQENYILQPGERRVFYVGFALEFPPGYAAIVKDKSSLPNHHGIHTMGGVYDAGYRGEYNIQLINLGQNPVEIKKEQKIAQLVIFPVALCELEEVAELDNTSSRGTGQFGSTGEF
ncbi:MAG: dUTP diphosphatase [Candidatus Magasanikiibacteriota bacterium]